jgi:uncharacterized protein
MVLASADPNSGWIGPPSDPADGNAEWARWLAISALLQWQQATGDARIMPAVYAHLHESYRRLSTASPINAWAQARYQDYVWLLQSILDSAPGAAEERDFLTALMWLVTGQQGVVWEEVWEPGAYEPLANTGWNFSMHGVNNAEGLKSGAILYRLTGSPYAFQSSFERLALLDLYHGAPHGAFLADETLAESMPSHGIELCLVVEMILSLNVMHEALGDASFADRAERVTYNALPGTWTAAMDAHQYLQQPNSVSALIQDDHIWLADGPDATTFGLAPNVSDLTVARRPSPPPHPIPH